MIHKEVLQYCIVLGISIVERSGEKNVRVHIREKGKGKSEPDLQSWARSFY